MSLEQDQQNIFDCFCKKIIKNEAVSILREYQRQAEMEVTFSALTERERGQLQCCDKYDLDRRTFPLLGTEVEIRDGDLARALAALTPERRNIVLLAYLMDMPDNGIAQLLQLGRSTVQYQRTNTLEELRKIMEGFENE